MISLQLQELFFLIASQPGCRDRAAGRTFPITCRFGDLALRHDPALR
jgi:hypothetical protein